MRRKPEKHSIPVWDRSARKLDGTSSTRTIVPFTSLPSRGQTSEACLIRTTFGVEAGRLKGRLPGPRGRSCLLNIRRSPVERYRLGLREKQVKG